MANHIWLSFADGSYLFHLKNKRIDEVETKCGAGLGDIYRRTINGTVSYVDDVTGETKSHCDPREAQWKTSELVEVWRQGLIGGARCVVDGEERDVSTFRVNQLIQNYLEDQPLVELWKLVVAGLFATMEGYEPPKAEAEADADPSPNENQSATPASSDREDTPQP